MKFLRQNPFLRVFVCGVCGIYVSSLLQTSHVFWSVAIGLFAFAMGMFSLAMFNKRVLQNYRYRWVAGVALFFLFALGAMMWAKFCETPVVKEKGSFHFGGLVTQIVQINEERVQLKIEVDSLVSPSVRVNGRMSGLFYIKGNFKDQNALLGKYVSGKGALLPFEEPSFPYQFDFGKHLRRNGFSFSFFVTEYKEVPNGRQAGLLLSSFNALRVHFANSFNRAMVNRQQQGVVQALLVGDKSLLDPELKTSYMKAGAIHVLAVSGLHVGILFLIISNVLLFLKRYRWLYIALCILFLWGYAWLTAFPPSVLRATIMFSVLMLGKESGLKISIYNLLSLSGFLILVIDPNTLFMVGFWLSHLAVLGIVLFYGAINRIVHFRFIGFRWAWSIISVSVAAQITTFPLMLMLFNGFPTYFLLSNLLVLPLVASILIGAILVSLLPVDDFLFKMVAGFVSDLVQFINESVGWVASLPGAYVENISLSELEVIVFFMLLIVFLNFLSSRKYRLLMVSLFLAVSMAVSLFFRLAINSQTRMLCMYVKRDRMCVNVIDGRRALLVYRGKGGGDAATSMFAGLWGRCQVAFVDMIESNSLQNRILSMGGKNCQTLFIPTFLEFDRLVNATTPLEKSIVVCCQDGMEAVCVTDRGSQTKTLYLLGRTLVQNSVSKKQKGLSASPANVVELTTGKLLVDGY